MVLGAPMVWQTI
ncbi:hypothetical protein PENSOL_c027G08217 [Penicillium solitum]|uniref:Uncharacterized protein n=1 Tax=Penicillium solitum TaxID=60172 RepID=A0A1V6QYZ3_9EURO|nr:hypothetical protein PENSOL_c027G08217 [Penicillium solitum]